MKFFSLSVLCSVVSALDLAGLLAGDYIKKTSSGEVSIPLLELSGITNTQSKVSELKINSADNANTLKAIKKLITKGVNLGSGEVIYMECVFSHNGYPESVNNVTTGDLADYLYNSKLLTYDQITALIHSTHDQGVISLMEGAQAMETEVTSDN